MAGTAAELAKLLNAVMTLLRKLDDDEASSLADGSAELRYISKSILKQFNQLLKLSDDQLKQLADGEIEYKLVPKSLLSQFNKLARLTDQQVMQLANGEAEFKFESKKPKTAKAVAVKTPPPTAAEVHQAMLSAPDQAAARAFFDSRKLKPADLKQIAKELDLPAVSSSEGNIETIIKVFVTGRLTTSAIRF